MVLKAGLPESSADTPLVRVRGLLLESSDEGKEVGVVPQAFNDGVKMIWHQTVRNDRKPVEAGCKSTFSQDQRARSGV